MKKHSNRERLHKKSLLEVDSKLVPAKEINTKKALYWEKQGRQAQLDLFHSAAKNVPAYKNFLKKNNIYHTKIKTYDDFVSKVPIISKKNYLQKNNLKDISWNGTLSRPLVLTSTSGSTGKPTYFTRSHNIDFQSSIIHEYFLRNSTLDEKKPTLVIICFSMGVWIGGLITYEAFARMGERGCPVSIITPGINKKEIFKILKNIGVEFEQIILAGYPPFLKDVVDEATEQKLLLQKQRIAILFAAEPFTESFRDYITKKIKSRDPVHDTMNIYGTADMGTMAFETPMSIFIRRFAIKHKNLFVTLFGSLGKTPTLAQFIPSFVNFTEKKGGLFLTGDNSTPLIQYDIGDYGGVLSTEDVKNSFAENGFDIKKEMKKSGLSTDINELPFVFVYERKDLSTTLYGLQIYPETIKEILIKDPFTHTLTGKFTLLSKFDESHNQFLEINLELKAGKNPSKGLEGLLLTAIIKNLRKKNSEFRELLNFLNTRAHPKLVFCPYEDLCYFKPGIKQAWVVKK